MVAPPSTQGAAFHTSLLRPGEGGRPPVPRGTGAGPSLPGLRSRAVVVPSSLRNDYAAIVAGARHVSVGRPGREWSRLPRRDHSGTVPMGRGSGDDSRVGTAGTRGVGAASKKSGMALPATLSLTRAPPRLWWARCSRTSTYVIVPRRAA